MAPLRSRSAEQPDQPSQPSGDTVEEIASGDGAGGMTLAGLVIVALAVVLAGGTAGIFAVWKVRWSGR